MEEPLSKNQELADYIKKNLSKGYDLDSLKYSLLSQGYSRTSVNKAIGLANKQMQNKSSIIIEGEEKEIKYDLIDDDLRKKVEFDMENEGFFSKLKRFFS